MPSTPFQTGKWRKVTTNVELARKPDRTSGWPRKSTEKRKLRVGRDFHRMDDDGLNSTLLLLCHVCLFVPINRRFQVQSLLTSAATLPARRDASGDLRAHQFFRSGVHGAFLCGFSAASMPSPGVSITRNPLTGWSAASVMRTDPFQTNVSFTTLNTITLTP